MSLTVTTLDDRASWNDALRDLPYAHVLQTWEWGDFKRATTGWTPRRIAFRRGREIAAMASVGVRRVGLAAVMYVPKGPALDYADLDLAASVLEALQRMARQSGAIWLKIDPDVRIGTGVPGEADAADDPLGAQVTVLLARRGWRFSRDQVQFRNTVCLDLTQPEDSLLAAMSQSARRKIRTAEREGVIVRAGTVDDLPLLYELYRITSARDQFLIRPLEYYAEAWRRFIEAGLAQPLIAEFQGEALAQVILFRFGRRCWYFYGASSNAHRDKQPNYLLQWSAIQWGKAQGCAVYDLWGAPDDFIESDPLWGVYQFKRGFHGAVVRHIGAWDYSPFPPLYTAYTEIMPRLIRRMRQRTLLKTKQTG